MKRDLLVKREGLTPPFQLKNDNRTDAISVCFSPHLKLISAEWVRNTNPENLRHAIRLLVRTAAVLRAELLLISIPDPFQVSEADMRWVCKFMREAMLRSPIRKVARVVPPLSVPGEREATLLLQDTSYDSALFNSVEEAQRWLLGERVHELAEDGRVHIPLQFNLRQIRNITKQETQTSTPRFIYASPDTLPQKPQILDICTDFVSITVDQGKKLMRISWKKPPQSRQYRYGMLKACRALIEHKLNKLLLNNQRMGVLTLEDQGWLVSMAKELLPKSNLQKLAVITSANALQQMSSEKIGQRLQDASLQHANRYFLGEEEAMDWLLTE